jgi:phage gp29-like protein
MSRFIRYPKRETRSKQRPQPGVFISDWRSDYSIETGRLSLTPEKLGSIYRLADAGDAEQMYEMFSAVEEDPHVHSVLSKRRSAVRSRRLQITPSIADGEDGHDRALQAADLCNRLIFGEDQPGQQGITNLREALYDVTDAIGRGFALLQIVWQTDGATIRPIELLHWPQRFVILGDPYNWTDQVSSDRIRLQTRENMTEGEPLHPNSWILHKHKTRSAPLPRAALLRTVAWWYLFKRFSVQDWAIFVERYGMPIRLGKYGRNTNDEERNVLKDAVISLGKDGGVTLPKDCDIEMVEMHLSGQLPQPILAEYCDNQISKAILGQTMTTDAPERGARSLGEVQKEAALLLAEDDSESVSETIRWDLCRPIVLLNLGENYPVPHVSLEQRERVDLAKEAERHKILAKDIGLALSATQLREIHGVVEPIDENDEIGGKQPVPEALGGPPQSGGPPQPGEEDEDEEATEEQAAAIAMGPCRICSLPVTAASYGGPDVCPWCDCGVHRDGSRWTLIEAQNPHIVKKQALEIRALGSKKKSTDWAHPIISPPVE